MESPRIISRPQFILRVWGRVIYNNSTYMCTTRGRIFFTSADSLLNNRNNIKISTELCSNLPPTRCCSLSREETYEHQASVDTTAPVTIVHCHHKWGVVTRYNAKCLQLWKFAFPTGWVVFSAKILQLRGDNHSYRLQTCTLNSTSQIAAFIYRMPQRNVNYAR